jgi:putative endonuclease
MSAWVYIKASSRNGTLYIGVTNDIARRAYEHKNGLVKGFASRHGCTQLVYFEVDNETGRK